MSHDFAGSRHHFCLRIFFRKLLQFQTLRFSYKPSPGSIPSLSGRLLTHLTAASRIHPHTLAVVLVEVGDAHTVVMARVGVGLAGGTVKLGDVTAVHAVAYQVLR